MASPDIAQEQLMASPDMAQEKLMASPDIVQEQPSSPTEHEQDPAQLQKPPSPPAVETHTLNNKLSPSSSSNSSSPDSPLNDPFAYDEDERKIASMASPDIAPNQPPLPIEPKHDPTQLQNPPSPPAVEIHTPNKKLSPSSSSNSSSPDSPLNDPFANDEDEEDDDDLFTPTSVSSSEHKSDQSLIPENHNNSTKQTLIIPKNHNNSTSQTPIPENHNNSTKQTMESPTSLGHKSDEKLIPQNPNNPTKQAPPTQTMDTPIPENFKNPTKQTPPTQTMEIPIPENFKNPAKQTPPTQIVETQIPENFKNPAKQAPIAQTMEQPPTNSYRIPSSVFARDKSNPQAEWSMASNESLFSIHTGNMSFTNDHFMWRSGELCEASTSGQMFSYSGMNMKGGVGKVGDYRSRELGIAEATMKEVIMENECRNNQKKTGNGCIAHRSEGSGASNMSFAFPALAGDVEKGASTRTSSSVKSGLEQPQSQLKPHTKQETHSSTFPDTRSPRQLANVARFRWFYCSSWWPLCK